MAEEPRPLEEGEVEELTGVVAQCSVCDWSDTGSLTFEEGELVMKSEIFSKCRAHHGEMRYFREEPEVHRRFTFSHERLPDDAFAAVGTSAVTAYFSLTGEDFKTS